MSNGPFSDQAAASQQQRGDALGQILGGGQTPPPPSNIEHAVVRITKLIEQHSELNNIIDSTIERINGPSPTKPIAGDEREMAQASGQLNELHRVIEVLEVQTRTLTHSMAELNGII